MSKHGKVRGSSRPPDKLALLYIAATAAALDHVCRSSKRHVTLGHFHSVAESMPGSGAAAAGGASFGLLSCAERDLPLQFHAAAAAAEISVRSN